MVKISIIVAAAENGVIGADGDMPWKLSTDLKRFKALTLGHPLVMGRKTFEAIGKPLPGRTTIVVTRDKAWQSEGVAVANSVGTALAVAEQIAQATGASSIFIVGGGEIYRQGLPHAHEVHLTRVHANPKGDTTFPELNERDWRMISSEEVPAGERDSAATTYSVFERVGAAS